jgi:hypothetical protein
MSIYVKKVETNLKSGCNVEIGLKTLIVGVNRSGKSTIVNAIEAALTGRVSDVAGRETLAMPGELWTLAPPLCASVFAQVKTSDDSVYQWILAKGKNPTRSVSGEGSALEVAFPLRAVYSHLTAGPEKARKWLLDTIVDAPWSAAEALISAVVLAQVTTLAGGSIAGLPTALEVAKARGREVARHAEALRERARGAAAALPPPADSVATDDIAAKLAEQEAGLAAAKTRLNATRDGVVRAQKEIEALPPAPPPDFAATGAALLTVLHGQIKAAATKCVVCSRENPADIYSTRLGAIERQMAVAMQLVKSRTAADSAVAVAIATHREVEREITLREQGLAVLRTAVAMTKTDSRWDDVKRMSGEADAAEADVTTWAKIADEVSHAISVLVERARVEFEKRVTSYLPNGLTFGLDLTDGDREIVRFGLRGASMDAVPGGLRSALSGAEWAMVTCAIATAITPDDVPSIIVPEERAFDPKTLAEALHAFGRFAGQVIVTSPIEPAEIPAGWTVVRTSGPAATVGTAAPATPPVVPTKRRPGRPRKVDAAKLNALIAAADAPPETRAEAVSAALDSRAVGEPALGVDEDADTTDFASLWDDA